MRGCCDYAGNRCWKDARLPDLVFMDNACALEKFALNPKRKERTDVTRKMATFHYMLDIWHVHNHSQCLALPDGARRLDPRHEANKEKASAVNTEACEQVFSFLDRITYVSMNMGPGHFAIVLYLIFDMENQKVLQKRRSE